MEYLDFNISRQGVKPQEKKIEAILNIATPTNVRQVCSFLGAINHYKQMIPHSSHVATEITALSKKGAKFKWTPNCQAAFETLKLELAKRVILTYPNFNKPFEIYTDASKLQFAQTIGCPNKVYRH